VKRNVPVDDARKDAALETAVQRLATRLVEGRARDLTVDGFKRIYEDHSWLLLRKSGTEPLIRVYSAAPSAARAEELAREGERLLRECL
jgi:phosphomannomutase